MSEKQVQETQADERPHLQTAVFDRFYELLEQDDAITPESLEAVKIAVGFDRSDRKSILNMVRENRGKIDGSVDETGN